MLIQLPKHKFLKKKKKVEKGKIILRKLTLPYHTGTQKGQYVSFVLLIQKKINLTFANPHNEIIKKILNL